MSLVIGGQRLEVDGLETVSWLDSPRLVPQATDGSPRATYVRGIVVHTVHGKRGLLRAGGRKSDRAEWYARYQADTTRQVSWDYTVDLDGTVACSNDPCARYTWHAGPVNPYTLGIELVQEPDGTMYEATIAACVRLVDFITRVDHPRLAIPRQTPWRDARPYAGRIVRAESGQNGRLLGGVYGHRNVWVRSPTGAVGPARGFGDPNDHPFLALVAAGYEPFESETGEDLARWETRQRALGADPDGIYGPATRKRAMAAGVPHGQWVTRPGD